MRIFWVILSGFVLTLAIFVGGAVTATAFLSAKPAPEHLPSMDTAELWTNEAVTVNTSEQDFERLPGRPVPEASDIAVQAEAAPGDGETTDDANVLIDTMTTAAIPAGADAWTEEIDPAVDVAHLEWCSSRYRSYDPDDNSYNPYSGGRRECISPYSGTMAATDEPDGDVEIFETGPFSLVASAYAPREAQSRYETSEHVRSCFSRYRSYRPEDNTYQPYGGGPRRQCQ